MHNKLKPMVYHAAWYREVLGEGVHDGYHWAIMSLGAHPCAYVGIPKGHPWYKKLYSALSHVECHGGLTYSCGFLKDVTIGSKVWWIGWDYAHFNDYSPWEENIDGQRGKKWTTEEIFAEVKAVVRQANEAREE